MEKIEQTGKWAKISRGIYKKPSGKYIVRFKRKGLSFNGEFDTIKEAETARKAKEEEVKKARHPYLKEESKIDFNTFAPIYADRHSKLHNPETYERVTKYTIEQLQKVFGTKKLTDINSFDVDTFRSKLLKSAGVKEDGKPKPGLRPSSINRRIAILHNMLNKAVEWGFISSHNLNNIKKLEEHGGKLRYLTKDEYDRLLAAANGKLKDIIIYAVATGLRMGNIRRLNVKTDADFERKRILLCRVKGHGKKPKYIPMNKTAAEVLSRQTEDKPFDYDFTQAFETAVKNAKLPCKGEDKVSFHTLRHTFASWLVMRGVSIFSVQRLLLHTKIETTMIYAHLAPDHLQEDAQKMDEILGR